MLLILCSSKVTYDSQTCVQSTRALMVDALDRVVSRANYVVTLQEVATVFPQHHTLKITQTLSLRQQAQRLKENTQIILEVHINPFLKESTDFLLENTHISLLYVHILAK